MPQLYRSVQISLIALCLFLVACGFHLRGEEELPTALKVIYLQSKTPYGSFEQTLRDSLRSYGVALVDSPNQANTILNITQVQLTPVAGSVSADLDLRQYTLNYVVTYSVLSPKGEIIVPVNSVTASTTFTSKMSEMMLSSRNSTQQYMPSLQRDAVFRIISQLLSKDSQQELAAFSRSSRGHWKKSSDEN